MALAISHGRHYLGRMQIYSAQQIEQDSFIKSAIVLPAVDSTNSFAKQLVRAGQIELPAVVVANRQSAGRGREDKSWWSGQGSLCMTLIDSGNWPVATVNRNGLTALAAAIAACETVALISGLQPTLKWPNDVMLDGKKLGGILIEILAIPQPATLVGIGLNTNCRMSAADANVQKIATSLIDVTARQIDQQSFLIALLARLDFWLHGQPAKGIIDTFKNYSHFAPGQPICLETSRFGTISGKFEGIGRQGELVLSIDGKPFVVESGTNVTAL